MTREPGAQPRWMKTGNILVAKASGAIVVADVQFLQIQMVKKKSNLEWDVYEIYATAILNIKIPIIFYLLWFAHFVETN